VRRKGLHEEGGEEGVREGGRGEGVHLFEIVHIKYFETEDVEDANELPLQGRGGGRGEGTSA
jgi:hypothetical protein